MNSTVIIFISLAAIFCLNIVSGLAQRGDIRFSNGKIVILECQSTQALCSSNIQNKTSGIVINEVSSKNETMSEFTNGTLNGSLIALNRSALF
jgi:hypothetical protein